MKKLIILILCAVALFRVSAQTDGFSYQALIIDQNAQEIPGVDITGNYLVEASISLLFTVYNSDSDVEYQELHETMTDRFGMVNLIIGSGEHTGFGNESFNMIDWDGTAKELEVQISYTGTDFEVLSREELLFLPYAYHRDIYAAGDQVIEGSSTLNGETTVNSNFYVLNGGNALFGADLLVEGNTDLMGELNVLNSSPTYLTGSLTVDGLTQLNDNFNVNNGAAAYFSGDATFDGDVTFNAGAEFLDLSVTNTTTMNGPATAESTFEVNGETSLNDQVIIDADINGDQFAFDSYPLIVEGSNQGILIKVDGTANESKNFLTFINGSDQAVGRVEGQTLDELQSSFRFIWDVVMGGLEQAFIAAEGAACSAQLDIGEATVMVLNTAVMGAQWVELTAYYELNVGCNFSSGGADYAEYLPKMNPAEQFHPGQVVGVHAGQIAYNTANADHYMVVSTNPIVLGNMPEEGKESDYAVIGFIGQVPTQVLGQVNEGDYILPSGNNDGFGVAFSPEELPTHRFNEIIGIAWESGDNIGSNIVNVAVGLNTNDLAQRVAETERELASMKSEMELLKSMIASLANGDDPSFASAETGRDASASAASYDNSLAKSMVPSTSEQVQFEEWLEDYQEIFVAHMTHVKGKLNEIGADYQQYPDLAMLLDDPITGLKKMHSGELLAGVWSEYAKRYQIK
ncbi:hypothetical protein [Sanyastnella coralliicola]|uniref:hypothetical protein n=1 Tax=Sanyastnella coralliicola TaxID=3069118 RepID=UPI0027B98E53|nr:hypothetical protein [Longitalea sp. SCSIO 12813]